MSVTNLVRYGTTKAPDWAVRRRREDRAADRKAHAAGLRRYNEEVYANKQVVRFDKATFDALKDAYRRGAGGPCSFWGLVSVYGYVENGDICIRIKPETARGWAKWMRQPDVSVFTDALARLDEIAGLDRPEGRAIKIRTPEFHGILATLEGPQADKIPEAWIGAKFLRRARIENGMVYVYASPAQAARLAEIFVAAKIDRGLILSLDHLSGRTEPRPF